MMRKADDHPGQNELLVSLVDALVRPRLRSKVGWLVASLLLIARIASRNYFLPINLAIEDLYALVIWGLLSIGSFDQRLQDMKAARISPRRALLVCQGVLLLLGALQVVFPFRALQLVLDESRYAEDPLWYLEAITRECFFLASIALLLPLAKNPVQYLIAVFGAAAIESLITVGSIYAIIWVGSGSALLPAQWMMMIAVLLATELVALRLCAKREA